jgi:hypothetical protein
MGPDMVVVFHLLPHDDLSFFNTVEGLSYLKVVDSEGAIKAFTKAIFPGAAGLNVSSLYVNTSIAN